MKTKSDEIWVRYCCSCCYCCNYTEIRFTFVAVHSWDIDCGRKRRALFNDVMLKLNENKKQMPQ